MHGKCSFSFQIRFVVSERTTLLGPQWYFSAKFIVALLAWLAFAVVMNVRYATAFRGARAAWLSIAGVVLLLAVYGIAVSLPPLPPPEAPQINNTSVQPSERPTSQREAR